MAAKKKSKHSKEGKLSYDGEDLRWATNELVSDWRAQRLKADRIADVGCGIGLQAMSFAKKAAHVVAIDLDQRKIDHAKKNAAALHFRNIQFLAADALSKEALGAAKDSQVVFLDPQREETEGERTVESIKPNIKEFLEKYGKITDAIAIEFPPQIREIPFDCEKEYASVNGKLNRLTLYFGKLKRVEKSVVALPEGATLVDRKGRKVAKKTSPAAYIYEADTAVQKAGLLAELTHETETALFHEKKHAFLTSLKLVRSPFFRNTYKVLDALEVDKDRIRESMQKLGIGKVLIRFEVDPQDYWKIRKEYEEGMTGKKEAVLFEFDGLAVIAEKITF